MPVEGSTCHIRVGQHDLAIHFNRSMSATVSATAGAAGSAATNGAPRVAQPTALPVHQPAANDTESLVPKKRKKPDENPAQSKIQEDEKAVHIQIKNISASMLWLREQFLLFPAYPLVDHARKVQWLRARIEGMLSKLETRRKTLDSMDGISAPIASADPLRLVSRGELDDLMEWLSTCLKFVDPWNKFVPNDPTVLYDGPCMSLSVQELQKQQHHS